ncbi:MAG: hypothetical protein ACLFO5_05700 [Opitutales bacterium]
MKHAPILRPLGPLHPLLLTLLTPVGLTAEDKNETVGPQNQNPTVKFFSEMPGSTHTLDVYVATGWQFVEGPDLANNPDTLWTKVGSRNFDMASVGDLNDGAGVAETEAEVQGKIRRTGGGGGGGSSSAIDVSVTMLTRYFSMTFQDPFNDREYVHEEEEDIPVKVTLANASGEPATANVDFSFENNAATLQESTTYNNGSAENLLTVTGDAGDTFTITAEADNVDITESRTASGENTSATVTIFSASLEPEFEDPLTLMDETELDIVLVPESAKNVIDEYTFEIKFKNESQWFTLNMSSEDSFDWVSRVAGEFDLRANVKKQGGIAYTLDEEDERQVVVEFPDWVAISDASEVDSKFQTLWQTTKNDATDGARREHGAWVLLNTDSGEYGFDDWPPGEWADNDEFAAITPSSKPDDDPVDPNPLDEPTYLVAAFHTHPPATYQTDSDGNQAGLWQAIGPSPADDNFHNTNKLPGIVYDYTATGTDPLGRPAIPFGHPKNSDAQLFHSGDYTKRLIN